MDPFAPAQVAMALQGVGAEPACAADLAGELHERHREPHRRYHTAEHIREVLAEVLRLVELDASTWADEVAWSPAVHLAALFHDAVYDVSAPSAGSEEASAQLALERLGAAGLGPEHESVHEVVRLIRLTAGHVVDPADGPGALLVDADLWILSAPTDRYDRYARDVRAEHRHLTDDVWASGRGAVLRGFLDGVDGLYGAGSPADRAHRRCRAVANLTRELAALPT